MRVLILLFSVLPFFSCSRTPPRTAAPPAPSGYAYTERRYPDPKRPVQLAGAALLRDLLRMSTPTVPGDIAEGENDASIGWVYSRESGELVRRRYHLSYLEEQKGTLVIASIQEERKDEQTGNWEPVVANNATHHSFFIRLQRKIRKFN